MEFHINFQLRAPSEIVPWGGDYLSWFGLTDGLLWINAGEDTIYEYSQAAEKLWENDCHYNDYQLSRFLEDFSETFSFIREPIPEPLYDNIHHFIKLVDAWKEIHINEPDDIFDSFYDHKLEPLRRWFFNRVFDSGHLIGGPLIGCFRCGSKIKLYWDSDFLLDSGTSIWTSPRGVFEMSYESFLSEVSRFFCSFFAAMDCQVERAVNMDWGNVRLDKQDLIFENSQRKIYFRQCLELLSMDTETPTNWSTIMFLYNEMRNSLGLFA